MILTCPRCATRFLVDPLHVWTTGRVVQCDVCGQRWRAVGEGVRPAAEPEPPAEPDPPVAHEPDVVSSPEVEAESRDEIADGMDASESPGLHEEAVTVEAVEPSRDWHATLAEAQPATEEALTVESPLRKAPQRLTSSFGSARPGPGRWLAIVFLVMIVLAAAVMFRDVIVEAFPGLAPIYASMGLLVHPAAIPHGSHG